MKKKNIIKLASFHPQRHINEPIGQASVSKELEKAIQELIYRMRELGPIKR